MGLSHELKRERSIPADSARDVALSGPVSGGRDAINVEASKADKTKQAFSRAKIRRDTESSRTLGRQGEEQQGGEVSPLSKGIQPKQTLSRAQIRRATEGPPNVRPLGEEQQWGQGSPLPPWPEVTNQPEFKALAQRRASELAAQRSMRRASEGSFPMGAGVGPAPDGDFSF